MTPTHTEFINGKFRVQRRFLFVVRLVQSSSAVLGNWRHLVPRCLFRSDQGKLTQTSQGVCFHVVAEQEHLLPVSKLWYSLCVSVCVSVCVCFCLRTTCRQPSLFLVQCGKAKSWPPWWQADNAGSRGVFIWEAFQNVPEGNGKLLEWLLWSETSPQRREGGWG